MVLVWPAVLTIRGSIQLNKFLRWQISYDPATTERRNLVMNSRYIAYNANFFLFKVSICAAPPCVESIQHNAPKLCPGPQTLLATHPESTDRATIDRLHPKRALSSPAWPRSSGTTRRSCWRATPPATRSPSTGSSTPWPSSSTTAGPLSRARPGPARAHARRRGGAAGAIVGRCRALAPPTRSKAAG